MKANTSKKIKINEGTYAIVHLEKKAIVIVGAQSGEKVAITPGAARALAKELVNMAILAEGQSREAIPTMLVASKPQLAM